jgi:uncharacterized protein (UPF0332 family)
MKAEDFLVLARFLAAESTEAAWRSAVSRSYYAMFHVGRQLMEDLGFTIPHADQAHRYLVLRLSNSGNQQVIAAGRQFDVLRRDRNQADYDFHRVIRQPAARTDTQLAEDIMKVLEAAALEPTRSQITDAMKIYERDVLKDVTWHP